MAASMTKLATVAASPSWSSSRRRLRPNHEKVRSTARRRGSRYAPEPLKPRLFHLRITMTSLPASFWAWALRHVLSINFNFIQRHAIQESVLIAAVFPPF